MRRVAVVLALGFSLGACKKGPGPKVAARVDDDQVLQRLRDRQSPAGFQAKYKIRIEGPETGGSTRGAMLLQDPDHLRMEVLTPLRTPLLTVASDGAALHAWSQQRATFYRGDQAAEVLAELTSGAVGIDDVVTLLTGGLPLESATVLQTRALDTGLEYVLEGPEDMRVRALVAPKRGFVRELEVAKALQPGGVELGPPLLQVKVEEVVRAGKYLVPAELVILLPTVGWTVEFSFTSWQVLMEVPPVFELTAPRGAREEDLVETLREVAAAQGG